MADIGLNPPGTRHDRVVSGVASVAGIKFGDVVLMDVAASGQHAAVTLTATAGASPIKGICVTQTNPTTGSAIGDPLEICTQGIAEVNLAASTVIVKGDKLITSTTLGAVKKLAAETTPDVLGRADQDMASTANVTRISCEIGIYQHA